MSIKERIKTLLSNGPAAQARREKMRGELENRDFSFLVPNCLGGILLHDLGLRFLSPTVNLMMRQDDFLSFVTNLDAYLSEQLSFLKRPEGECPRAFLSPAGLPQILIHFTHYKTEQDASQKWYERAKRLNKDNLFILIEERDGIGRKELEAFGTLKARGIVAFTCNEYPDLPYCVYLPQYHAAGEVGNILKKHLLDDSREYEHHFDFVKWFNEADGGEHDVRPFLK